MSTAAAPGATVRARRRYGLPKVSLAIAGLLTLLVGAWAGIVAFVGPLFGFSADGAASWYWNLDHGVLFLAPGVAACAGGLMTLMGARTRSRALAAIGGVLGVISGAWLIVGSAAWPVLESGAAVYRAGSTPLMELAYRAGYSLGPGAMLVLLGAFIIGSDRVRVVTHIVERPAPSESVTTIRPDSSAGSTDTWAHA